MDIYDECAYIYILNKGEGMCLYMCDPYLTKPVGGRGL